MYTEQEQKVVNILIADGASLPVIKLTNPTHQLIALAKCYVGEDKLQQVPTYLCWRVQQDSGISQRERTILQDAISSSIRPRGSVIGWLQSRNSYDYSTMSCDDYVRVRNIWIKQTLANHNTTIEEQLKPPSIVVKFVRWYRNRFYK